MRGLVAVGVLAAGGGASAAGIPGVRLPGNFGAVSPFYVAPHGARLDRPGRLLRIARQPTAKLMPGASRGWKLLFASVGWNGRPVAESGLLMVPRGRPPRGGWPVISYGHGTVGIASTCAPSLDPNTYFADDGVKLQGELSSFLRAGYAVVIADYQGLGTAGPSPYINGPMEAHAMTDIVRAARQADSAIGRRWIAMGQSQGAQAALFTGEMAGRLAPELRYLGTVATAPPSHFPALVAKTSLTARIITPLFSVAIAFVNPHVQPGPFAVLNADGDTLLRAYETSCLTHPGTVIGTFVKLYGKPLLKGGETNGDAAISRAEYLRGAKGHSAIFEPPRGHYSAPLFIADGTVDEFIPYSLTQALAASIRRHHTPVTFRLYSNIDHEHVPYAALPDTLRFVRGLFR